MRLRALFRDPGWLAVVLVGGAAFASIGAMVASRLLIPAERAGISTGAWPWTAEGVVVEPLTPDSEFRPGDVVVAVDGRPLADWAGEALRPPWLLGGPRLGSSAEFDVLRGGVSIHLTAALAPFPTDRLGGAPLGLVVFGATALVLALALIVRRPRALVLRLLVLGVACDLADIVAWETGLQPTDLVARTPFLYAFGLGAVFSLVFWSSLIHLLSVYPVRAGWLARRPRAIVGVYAAPLLALGVGGAAAAIAGGGVLVWLDRLAPLTGAISSASVLAVLVSIVAGYRRTPLPRRSQVRLIAVSLFVAATATLLLVGVPIALSREPLVPRGVVAILALPVVGSLALAVIRDHLFQVDLLASSRTRIVAAREEERLRLRRELHDGLGPTLAALGLKVDAARDEAAAGDATDLVPLLDEIRGDVRGILGQIRTLSRELRPPTLDSLGLVGGLRQQVDALTLGGPTTIEVIAGDLPELPPGVEVAAYRIVLEAVTNLVRHAGATTASVRLAIGDHALRIDVIDDGIGMEEAAIGVGTRAMYERAAEVGGELTIEPGRHGGTHLVASLPIGPRSAAMANVPSSTRPGVAPTAASGAAGPGLE
jgi:signal transduction histidine kinase